MVLIIRSDFVAADRRRAFRVPVLRDSGLRVELRTNDGHTWRAEAVNLSVTGILVELPTAEAPALAIGATVTVRLTLGNDTIEIQGEVNRREQRAVGLSFAETLVRAKVAPPPALAAIVRSLERHWLDTKRRSGDAR